MKIAYILPSLKNQAPIIVARDIIMGIIDKVELVEVYYFDSEVEVNFPCKTHQISLFTKINFNKYDVIHSHMLRPDFYIWLHRKASDAPKFVSTLHQFIYDNLKGNYNKLIAFTFEKIWLSLLSKQDTIICLTHLMSDFYKKKIKERIVIYNGRILDTKLIHKPIEEHQQFLKIKDKYKIIGTHCRLTKRKGVHQSIEALKYLTDYFLVIIGDGIEMQNLKNLAQKHNITDRCWFLGYKQDAISYLKYFDIYIATSYSEGFPLSLIEAGQCKVPIVCSDIDIFKEIYSEKEVIFYQSDNINSLVQSINKAYNNKEKYSEAIYKKVTDEYSLENMAHKYLDLYQK